MLTNARFSFGPFVLDAARRQLSRGGAPVSLKDRHYELLHLLVSQQGELVSKDRLIETAWKDVAVTDNSLKQAISSLRRMLGSTKQTAYIETVAWRGYRFVAPVTSLPHRESDDTLERLLEPHRAWLDGRAALESMTAAQIPRARAVFESLVAQAPHEAAAHIGLANALVAQFEATRVVMPDRNSLARAVHHAREACRLDANNAEAWATLGFVLGRPDGDYHAEAVAASHRATVLEPGNWRHHVRLAATAWGDERLAAAHRATTLLPGCSLAHWLAASVHVARCALADAERELLAGLQFEGSRAASPSRLLAIGLNWLLGLVQFARGDTDAALAAFDRELALEDSGHLYARECAANSWYAIGAVRLHQGRAAEAGDAFRAALDRVPLHPMAIVGLDLLGESPVPAPLDVLAEAAAAMGFKRPFVLDVASAASLVRRGREAEGVTVLQNALMKLTPGSVGWPIPIDPLLHISPNSDVWSGVLTCLRLRAA